MSLLFAALFLGSKILGAGAKALFMVKLHIIQATCISQGTSLNRSLRYILINMSEELSLATLRLATSTFFHF